MRLIPKEVRSLEHISAIMALKHAKNDYLPASKEVDSLNDNECMGVTKE